MDGARRWLVSAAGTGPVVQSRQPRLSVADLVAVLPADRRSIEPLDVLDVRSRDLPERPAHESPEVQDAARRIARGWSGGPGAIGSVHRWVIAAADRRAPTRPVARDGLRRCGRPPAGEPCRGARVPAPGNRRLDGALSIERRPADRVADLLPGDVERGHALGGLGSGGHVGVVFACQPSIRRGDDLVLGLRVDLECLVRVGRLVRHEVDLPGMPGLTSRPRPAIEAARASGASGLRRRNR